MQTYIHLKNIYISPLKASLFLDQKLNFLTVESYVALSDLLKLFFLFFFFYFLISELIQIAAWSDTCLENGKVLAGTAI